MACCLFGLFVIIYTVDNLLSIGPLGINFSEVLNKNTKFFVKKLQFKFAQAKCRIQKHRTENWYLNGKIGSPPAG